MTRENPMGFTDGLDVVAEGGDRDQISDMSI